MKKKKFFDMKITDQLILIPNVLQARQGKMNNSTQAAQTTWHNRKTVEYEEGSEENVRERREKRERQAKHHQRHHWVISLRVGKQS